ncbi:aspartyl/glutamyl-tRNA amidotransferase subunit A [Candidatus Saccharibacteria bacterium]|nr:aspartyl/glutamyl-tRNA amidotransferase subunit A [Candidatus Saccharibacteria bacterium]
MQIATKEITAESLVRAALDKAKKYVDYNIFISLDEDGAIKKAKAIDKKLKDGEDVGRLAGVPFAIKDNFLAPVGNTTAASKILEPLKSPITATSVKKLEDEGAILIGRTNLDSFAHGSSTENSYFGPTLNSHDKARVAGGSSGGSAVAVALDIVPFATGTDTGGSIRQPASFNGVYGFKPTYGTISRYGVVAMASSTDCIGFFAKSAEDIDLLMSITSGQDPKDMTTLPDYYNENRCSAVSKTVSLDERSVQHSSEGPKTWASALERPEEELLNTPQHKTIGIIKDFNTDALHPEIKSALENKIKELKSAGHKVIELDMPTLKYALAVYYIVVPAEISSNLSRHDGIRYGYRNQSAKNLEEIYGQSRSDGFMPENKRRIMIGNFVLSSGFYDAYYLKAQQARTLIIKEYEKAFSKCDFLLTPVSPNPAFKIGEKINDPISMYLEDVMSVPINLAGLPGLSFPVGETKSGLSIGLQLIGSRRSDKELLSFAATLGDNANLSDKKEQKS